MRGVAKALCTLAEGLTLVTFLFPERQSCGNESTNPPGVAAEHWQFISSRREPRPATRAINI